jgi:Subtilase family
MTRPVVVGLVDSGVVREVRGVEDGQAFALDAAGAVVSGAPAPDVLGHGTALARLIRAAAPGAGLLNAQVFGTTFLAAPAAVAAAIDWVVGAGARVVNLSFGLRADRDVLRAACAAAEAAGVLLVAASAARGAPVFPAAYPGVLRVSGDARCGPEEVSDLEGEPAHFGASPVASGATGVAGGASFACARVSGMLAAVLAREPGLGAPAVLARLRALAMYRGRERRGVA